MSRPDPRPVPDPANPTKPARAHRPQGVFESGDLAVLAALILGALLIGLAAWIALTVSAPGH